MHQRAALNTGEHSAVDRLAVFFFGKTEAGARAAQRFMCSCCDEIGHRHGAVMQPGCNEPRIVGHIDHQLRADFARDLGKLVVRDFTRVGAGPRDDQLRLVLPRLSGNLIEVEPVRVARHTIADEMIKHAADVQLHAVGQVSAVGQVEAHHRVAGLERREIDRGVGLRSAVRLHVGELRSKKLLRTVDRELLDDIDELAAAIVTLTWIAFGILVRQHAAGCLHHCGARIVFTRDHFEAVGLALDLVGNRLPNIGVVFLDEIRHGKVLKLSEPSRKRPPFEAYAWTSTLFRGGGQVSTATAAIGLTYGLDLDPDRAPIVVQAARRIIDSQVKRAADSRLERRV